MLNRYPLLPLQININLRYSIIKILKSDKVSCLLVNCIHLKINASYVYLYIIWMRGSATAILGTKPTKIGIGSTGLWDQIIPFGGLEWNYFKKCRVNCCWKQFWGIHFRSWTWIPWIHACNFLFYFEHRALSNFLETLMAILYKQNSNLIFINEV